jgi:hypothetical protein
MMFGNKEDEMKKITNSLIAVLILSGTFLYSETLFEVKDSSNNKVLDVSTDGLRIMNLEDTLMVISPSGVRVNLNNSATKGLSRSFSVSTTTSKGKGLANVLEVGTEATTMREGVLGQRYTNFSPENIFIGLESGTRTLPNGTWRGMSNIFLGNRSGYWNDWGSDNIFIGDSTGFSSRDTDKNIFIGNLAGFNTQSDDPGYGSANVFVGTNSGFSNIEGHNNVYIGNQAGEGNPNGMSNVFIGSWAGNSNTKSNNTVVGGAAFYQNTTGATNTVLGSGAGTYNLSGSGNVFLGYQSGYNETGSNRLYIENSNSATPLIWGDFANDMLRFNGTVGVNATPSSSYGIYAINDYLAVRGSASTATGGYTYGVYGVASGGITRNASVYGATASGTGTNWSGYFVGNVYVGGTVSKSADEVKIDHPLDPENKYLSLSSVASNEMTNILNGNVKLDSDGKAIIKLPEWFEPASTDFRYQLTAIGAPGPNLYISKEIGNNSFEIAGGSSGMKVSWMVTAVRNDNYAKSNPIVNETDKKSDEKGYYLHPESYGKPEESGIEYLIQQKEKTELR